MSRHQATGWKMVRAAAVLLTVLAAGACSTAPSPRGHAAAATTKHDGHGGHDGSNLDGHGKHDGQARVRPPRGCGTVSSATMVSSAAGLQQALSSVQPGATIELAAGRYRGNFTAAASGTATAPITLCGPRSAVLTGTSTSHGYTFYLDHASWWQLNGFSVTGGQKGGVADGVSHDIINGLYVHHTGDEAIHLRSFSSDNTVSNNLIRTTGLDVPFYGEGIYVGSANSNWCEYTGCKPDASDDNTISGNNIADTTAENIDIKEGTTGGTITRNILNGTAMQPSAATAWINVKGNDWQVTRNRGTQTTDDGFQVHQVYPGWGIGNVFRGNKAAVPSSGFGIYVQSKSLQTIVACSNVATGGPLSNISCSH